MTAAIADEFGRIPMSPFLKATLARAADYASAQLHREVTLEHLLLALAEDPEASVVLKSSQIDIQRLMSDVSGFLGRNDDRVEGPDHAAAAISGDLRRILEASAAAASQGRRREINGAIVLAAIVGDGKSPAAHMLRSQGLTFEQAIRALQQAANTQANQPAAPRAATADDIMASARERVLTRTAPPDTAAAERTQPPQPAPMPAHAMPTPPAPPTSEVLASSDERTTGGGRNPSPMAPPPAPVPLDPMADRMAQSSLPRPEPAGGPLVQSASPAHPNSAPYPQASQSNRPSPPQQGPGSQTMPAPGQGWAPPPAPVVAAAPAATPPRQNPFPPMNNMRPPGSGPAPLPPFPPIAVPAGQNQGGFAQQPLSPGQFPPQFPASQPMARPPGPPQSAPWAEHGGPPAPRGPHYDDAMARLDARRPQQPPGSAQPTAPAPHRRPPNTTTVQAGQLVENIPRKMRAFIPVIVEARIARAEVKAIADGLQGDGAVFRHEVTVTKAMSVRLRAPDGGFYIETASPETQWIENVLGLMSNDYASWRWSVTPQERGKRKLQLVISARTVGTDGLTAETALPDQIIDVAIGINVTRTLIKWGTWLGAAVAGGLLSHFGDTIFEFGKALIAGAT